MTVSILLPLIQPFYNFFALTGGYMARSYIGLKYEELKERFSKFFIHKKKVRALENYASVKEFAGAKYIRILKELLIDGFLDKEEEQFLDYQIRKAEIDAFTWCHRTRWLKSEMARLEQEKPKRIDPQIYLPLGNFQPQPTMSYPVELIAAARTTQGARV